MSTIAVKQVKLGNDIDPSKNFVISVPAVADGTLTIKRESGTAVLSIAANGKAVIPGVVGTVAQVGGVPTGQIVERGSNANGEYVRFADGTQICWHRTSGALVVGAAGIANLYSADRNWTFPSVFVGYPAPSGAGSDNANVAVSATAWNTSFTGCVFRYHTTNTNVISTDIRYLVVGRWF